MRTLFILSPKEMLRNAKEISGRSNVEDFGLGGGGHAPKPP